MALIALGLNHQTAPVSLREQIAFSGDRTSLALRELLALPGVREAALLSTCNRTELYASVDEGHGDAAVAWLARHHDLGEATLRDYLYQHVDADAVRHLFRVATGLDSLVLGEPQILGQVKEAWSVAREASALRTPMDRLFQQCFSVAKRVRTDTRIGANPVSVAFAGVRLAQQVFAELDQATVMLVGAGETIELAARHLVDARAKRLLVANRTLEHAQALASRFGGYALPLSEIGRHLAEADVVISATASRDPVIRTADVGAALRQRRRRPMFMLDLAVPRDIESGVADLDDVYLYTVDDLEQVVEENRRSRREAAHEAEAIIELQVEHFMNWWQGTERQDVLRRMRDQGESLRDQAMARARQQLVAGRDPETVMQQLAHSLTNKLLHAPTAALRQAAQRGDAELLRHAERLFTNDEDPSPASDPDHDAAQPPPKA
ncbi:glutamyl-tRNA reductase [Alkalisalibacterium limincola]|uniref:Glutamyl-tRNA reductase n=1 Tax=Alkalisalibacterium limincola TaxID=2699169 RepID=A0A5C8KV06_9GAMM|nr:glutamyl-tRNA reductase [Alkalisalibacterium limincola]TXK65141.1 glutamyl-tRNA reductase [Alkalisalibacterium limincola]